jgi:hypothetical protein
LSDLERQRIQQKIDAEIQEKKIPTIYRKNSVERPEDAMEMESTVMAVDDIAKKLKKSKARDLKKEDDSSDEDEGEAANEDDINRMENFTSLPGDLIEVDLKKNDYGFGLALAGHCNRNRMGTYICGIHPQGSACEDGRLQVGDELLKV